MSGLLFNRWIFSDEAGGVRTYQASKAPHRQETEDDSFEIKENGEFVRYSKTESGVLIKNVGRFEIKENTIYVYFKDHYSDLMFSIVSVDNNALKVIW
jgi:predicted lipase